MKKLILGIFALASAASFSYTLSGGIQSSNGTAIIGTKGNPVITLSAGETISTVLNSFPSITANDPNNPIVVKDSTGAVIWTGPVLNSTTAATATTGTATTGSTGTTTTPTATTTSSGVTVPYVLIPRSRVDLDSLNDVKRSIATRMNSTEDADGKWNFGIDYIGGISRDLDENIIYSGSSNGVSLSLMKNYGTFDLGGTLAFQKSDVDYEGLFSNTKEEISSTQISLDGRYRVTDAIAIDGILSYSKNDHKFNNTIMDFDSSLFDIDTRVSYKYSFNDVTVKPYIGLGYTQLKETSSQITEELSNGSVNGLVGLYAEAKYTNFSVFGDLEYQHNFNGPLHAEKMLLNGTAMVEELQYSAGEFNAGLGARYTFLEGFDVTGKYEFTNLKNHTVKLGLEYKF